MARGVQRKMGSRLARLAPFASLFALAACSSVLGIEDLHQGPAPGSGGSDSGGTNTGGTSAGGSDTNPTGGTTTVSGGSAGKGQGGGTGGSTVIGMAGDSGIGEAGTGGTGAVGGSGATGGSGGVGGVGGVGGGTSGAVTGHVIDYWGRKLASVPVQIGATLSATDSNGVFVVANAPATYDVSLVVDFGTDQREIYGWVYQGLTRRDPTLQVYSGLERHSGYANYTATGATLNTTRTLHIALGGPGGSDDFEETDVAGSDSAYWRGGSTTTEQAHGLLWQFNASNLPTSYIAYDTASVALNEVGSGTAYSLNLAPKTIASGNITGTVTPATSTSRENDVFLRFTSGASIELAADTTGPNTFSYLVPTIANASTTFAAVEGDAFYGQYAVAHKDILAAGTGGITAAIPTPCKPLTPASSATNVGEGSQFTFVAGAGSAGTFVVSMIDNDFYNGLYIVTTNKSFALPSVVGGGYVLSSTHSYSWRVETHGSLATVDAMTGPTGFMDEFSGDEATPSGPHAASGSFTISQSNSFTAK